MTIDAGSKRYLLSNLKFNRKFDDWDETPFWSLYLVDALTDAGRTSPGKWPDFMVRKCLHGPNQILSSPTTPYAASSMPMHQRGWMYTLDKEGFHSLLRAIFVLIPKWQI